MSKIMRKVNAYLKKHGIDINLPENIEKAHNYFEEKMKAKRQSHPIYGVLASLQEWKINPVSWDLAHKKIQLENNVFVFVSEKGVQVQSIFEETKDSDWMTSQTDFIEQLEKYHLV